MASRPEEFLQTVATDATLRQNLENAATPEARRQIIDAAGFADVSKEDIAATAKRLVPAVAELSDAELEAVAGGDEGPGTTAYVASALATIAYSLDQLSPAIIIALL